MSGARIKAALAKRYAVERELGRGGMATVYLARDLKHDRHVAVKVLRPELAAAIGSDRFLREIRITAQLNHPHILPLLDSGETDGLLYYVMPYVAGGSLRIRLNPDVPLEIDVAFRIAQQVASALDHAHRHGIIHRDVKPENILFSEGHAIVADFGIARAVSAASPENLTRSGFPVGTPGYMSPEQAMGIIDLDARTDVYSLACVVYEMLIGATPAVWPSDEGLRLGRLTDAPPEHRARLDALPGRVEQALTRALAVRPADRQATPVELADALAAALQGRVRLSDSQVREILGRAAELQAQHPTEEPALSIGAVEQIAAEVGIPPVHVRDAVAELKPAERHVEEARVSVVDQSRYDTLVFDRTVSGEVPESEYVALVDEIQATLKMVGHVSTLGKSLTWSPAAPGTEGRQLVVTITRQSGQTKIHLEERLELSGWKKIFPGAGAFLGALMVLALGVQGPEMVFPVLLFAGGGAFAGVRLVIAATAESRRPQLKELVARLAALAERAARPALASDARARP